MATLGGQHVAQLLGRQLAEIEEMADAPCSSPRRLLQLIAGQRDAGALEALHGFLDLGLGHDQGRQEPHHVVAGADREQLLVAQRR